MAATGTEPQKPRGMDCPSKPSPALISLQAPVPFPGNALPLMLWLENVSVPLEWTLIQSHDDVSYPYHRASEALPCTCVLSNLVYALMNETTHGVTMEMKDCVLMNTQPCHGQTDAPEAQEKYEMVLALARPAGTQVEPSVR